MKAGQWIRIGILTALCAGLIFFVIKYGKQFFQALHPLGFGIIIAYILLPLVETLDRLKVSRTISILTSFILSMIIISVVLLMIIPIFVDNIKELTAVLPGMFDEAFKKVEIFIKGNIPSSWQPEILKEVDNSLIKIQDSLTRAMYNFITSLPGTISFVLDVLLGWILSFYILKDKEQLVSGLKYFFPKSSGNGMLFQRHSPGRPAIYTGSGFNCHYHFHYRNLRSLFNRNALRNAIGLYWGDVQYYSLLRALYRRDSSPRCCPDDIAMESLMDRGCFFCCSTVG